jgi:short-subunit dehydrogenase
MHKNLQLALGVGTSLALALAFRASPGIRFRNRSILITGGSRGLGLLLAREFASEGAHLTLLARHERELEQAAAELRRYGTRVLTIPCDVTKQDEVEQAVRQAVQVHGRLDVLINNAGVMQVGPYEHTTLDDYHLMMDTHLWGPLHAINAAVPFMQHQGGGRIINIASIGGKIAVPHMVPYSASKFALVGLSDGLRAELARHDIRVTTVCPWLMRTGSYLHAQIKGQHEKEKGLFALAASLPLVSMSATRAAKRIVEACRRGEARLVLAPQGRATALLQEVFPRATAWAMRTVAGLLPEPAPGRGDEARAAWMVASPLAPSLLTRLSDRAAEQNNERTAMGSQSSR